MHNWPIGRGSFVLYEQAEEVVTEEAKAVLTALLLLPNVIENISDLSLKNFAKHLVEKTKG